MNLTIFDLTTKGFKWFIDEKFEYIWAGNCFFNYENEFVAKNEPNLNRIFTQNLDECKDKCRSDKQCAHFSFYNGICYLKNLEMHVGLIADQVSRATCGFDINFSSFFIGMYFSNRIFYLCHVMFKKIYKLIKIILINYHT